MKTTVKFHAAPGSIADRLAKLLGREPTNSELKAELDRVLAKPSKTHR